ncbi:MAG: hypothetical protein RI891_1578 [Gemmatimonadota bacterium]|jgi:hypothetical protein
MRSPRARFVPLAVLTLALAACSGKPRQHVMRLGTDDFTFRVTGDQIPPRALDVITYTIVVQDRETKEPIANGEGRLFATNSDRVTVWDGFQYGPEPGTYRARVKFLTAGEWALGVQFRRDSTQALQRTLDWRQTVLNEVLDTTSTP